MLIMCRAHGIHILLNWDGYSNNGVRPTGLFPMQCAPLQVAHQVHAFPPPPCPLSRLVNLYIVLRFVVTAINWLHLRNIFPPWGPISYST